jgi:4-hydroxybenzoate polyprenyltransferase
MRFLHFILSHSIFIAICAVALCFQTTILLTLSHNNYLYLFVFFATVCSYNLYWLLSKFYFSDRVLNFSFLKTNSSFCLLFILSGFAAFFLFLQLQYLFWYIIISVSLTLLYALPLLPFKVLQPLQRLGFLKTILLSFAWAFTTTFLPAVFLLSSSMVVVALLFLVRFFFMLLLCIIFDRRDEALDKIKGLHSLATDMSERKLFLTFSLVYFFYIATSMIFCFYFANMLQAAGFVITGLLCWIVYRKSNKKQGYVFYYFVVDGLMFVTSVISYLVCKV